MGFWGFGAARANSPEGAGQPQSRERAATARASAICQETHDPD